MFSKKTTKNDEIFTVGLTLYSNCQIDGEDFVIFCGFLRKHEVYLLNAMHEICIAYVCSTNWLTF